VLWFIPIIPALRRLRQEDCKYKIAGLDYVEKPYLKKKKKPKSSKNQNPN
jgi:hypothetical protein